MSMVTILKTKYAVGLTLRVKSSVHPQGCSIRDGCIIRPIEHTKKMNTKMLFQVPRITLLNVFKDWLCMLDIARFDSAFCNKNYRPLLLNHFLSTSFYFLNPGDHIETKRSYFLWVCTRQIMCRRLFVSCDFRDVKLPERFYQVQEMKISFKVDKLCPEHAHTFPNLTTHLIVKL